MIPKSLPLPPHYQPDRVDQIWRVAYQQRADDAIAWTRQHGLAPAAEDRFQMALLLIDVQNTFCLPDFELFVGGPSGRGAIDDNRRLCEFIYRNLHAISAIRPTLDTHQAAQIFHSLFWLDAQGRHPPAYTVIQPEDILSGRWRFNPALSDPLGIRADAAGRFLEHYVDQLKAGGQYDLTIWPYHAMLGGIGHALVASVEEAVFFHAIARQCPTDFQLKGRYSLTENYSAIQPEVLKGPDGAPVAEKNQRLLDQLLGVDALVVAGQAKSHCVAWTIAHLLREIEAVDRALAGKVYLLTDCTSPVVVPGVMDFSQPAADAFAQFETAGMHLVASTTPLEKWPQLYH